MIVLGVSGGHDANWCVVEDGRILGAFEKERFTRRKHDVGDVTALVPATLAYLGLTIDDIDVLATSEPIWPGTGPGTTRISGDLYESVDDWRWQTLSFLGRELRAVSVPHHLAHAAYSYYGGALEAAAVLCCDAGGEEEIPGAYTATTISSWSGGRLEWLRALTPANIGSLWWVYAEAVFGDLFAAGKLMGLAATGTDALVAEMRERYLMELPAWAGPGLTVRDLSHERHATPLHAPGADWSHPRSRDIAFGVQALTLEAGLALVRACRSLTGYHTLAFAGGLAQNGYLCTAARREGSFRDIFVPPAVYDGGLAAGCALFACHHALEVPLPGDGPGALDRIGMAYPRERCAAAVASIGGREVDREEAIEAAARTIAEGAVVAWFEGRSEHGPRALGSRSFLCRADDVALKDRVNATVKFRESFRPLAPVVPQEVAGDYFDIDWPSPYMMYIANGIESARDAVAGALHVDGSARLQTVAGDHSLRHIALRVGELVGVPMVINTSFNVRAPIVETPEDAVETALSVPVGLLYLDGMLAAPHG